MPRTPLTDDHLWALVNRYQATSLAEMSRRFGVPVSTISMAAKRLRERSWTCRVSYGVCSVCGESFTRQGHKAGRRAYHPECRPRALKILNAGYDAERWNQMDEERRSRLLDKAHTFTKSTQAETLSTATSRGARWQAWEDEFIQSNPDLTTAEIARELGRTLYAVTSRRLKLGQRRSDPVL